MTALSRAAALFLRLASSLHRQNADIRAAASQSMTLTVDASNDMATAVFKRHAGVCDTISAARLQAD